MKKFRFFGKYAVSTSLITIQNNLKTGKEEKKTFMSFSNDR